MTVKCLNEVQKVTITDLYRYYKHSKSKLAKEFKVSRRTINRVLEEQESYYSLNHSTEVPTRKATVLQQIKAFFGRLFS